MTVGDIEPFYERRPGDLVFSKSEVDTFPEGTTLVHGGETWTRTATGWRSQYDTRDRAFTPSEHGETALKAYPDGFEYVHDTLEQYQFKVRDVTLAAAARHGVAGVPETLQRLEVTPEKYPIGRGARIINAAVMNDLTILPPDSIISYGHPNSDTFTLYRRTPNMWQRVYGPSNHQQRGACIVEEVGGVQKRFGWLELRGDEAADPAVNEFKIKTWDEGNAARSRHSWCGVFAQVMNYLGINEQVVRSIRLARTTGGRLFAIGERVPPGQAAAMPVGTTFQYVGEDGSTYWYHRTDERVSNSAMTKRIYAVDSRGEKINRTGGNFAHSMTLLGYPDDVVRMPSNNLLGRMRALPPGAPWGFDENITSIYHMSDDGAHFGARDGDRRQWNLTGYANETETQQHNIFVRLGLWTPPNRNVF